MCIKESLLFLSGRVYHGIVYDWVLGLGGAPDEPHAVNVSEKTEGNGVGVLKEPPVSANGLPENVNTLAKAQTASSLCFRITLTDCLEVSWETLLLGRKLIVEIPNGILPEGSKERYVFCMCMQIQIRKFMHLTFDQFLVVDFMITYCSVVALLLFWSTLKKL